MASCQTLELSASLVANTTASPLAPHAPGIGIPVWSPAARTSRIAPVLTASPPSGLTMYQS